MTPNQIREARNHVTKLINAHPSHPDIERITNMGAHHLTAALDEIERLREALERCPPDKPQMSDKDFREAVNDWWRLHARAALNPEGGA